MSLLGDSWFKIVRLGGYAALVLMFSALFGMLGSVLGPLIQPVVVALSTTATALSIDFNLIKDWLLLANHWLPMAEGISCWASILAIESMMKIIRFAVGVTPTVY